MNLSERKLCILKAVIDDYIMTGFPVGSRTISKKNDIDFSSATIRNEMADLEELGFLVQPHTSAGRIPSHKAYRYYVDKLMKVSKLSAKEAELIKSYFEDKVSELEQVMEKAAQVLSKNHSSDIYGSAAPAKEIHHQERSDSKDHRKESNTAGGYGRRSCE